MGFKSRRERARKEHEFTSKSERDSMNESIQNERERREKKEKAKAVLETQLSYKIVKLFSRLMDDWCLDPIIGLLLPEAGDTITAVMSIPYLYVSVFKIKSYALTVVILKNILLDYLIGLIPIAGDILDFFIRSYNANYKLIVGYVEDDKETIRKVKKSALLSTLAVVFLFATTFLTLYAWYKLLAWIFG